MDYDAWLINSADPYSDFDDAGFEREVYSHVKTACKDADVNCVDEVYSAIMDENEEKVGELLKDDDIANDLLKVYSSLIWGSYDPRY